jgi:penicillin-insensitive murein endopeptidase
MAARRVIAGLFLAMLAYPGFSAEKPAKGPLMVLGSAAHGCLQGGVPLPANGPGWQVLRPDNNRYWGTPALISFLEDFGKFAQPMGSMQIGDMSLPRGGHMPTGHASHQTGLDADISFQLLDHPMTEDEREHPDFTSVLDKGVPSPQRWGTAQTTLLKIAATDPRVERIFVNPAIKRYLCRTVGADRDWLHAVRPWWGHEAHFHVRLRCPEGQSSCEPGPLIPPGDGCDASLDWWFSPEAGQTTETTPTPSGPRPRYLPTMPAACKALLDPRILNQ